MIVPVLKDWPKIPQSLLGLCAQLPKSLGYRIKKAFFGFCTLLFVNTTHLFTCKGALLHFTVMRWVHRDDLLIRFLI